MAQHQVFISDHDAIAERTAQLAKPSGTVEIELTTELLRHEMHMEAGTRNIPFELLLRKLQLHVCKHTIDVPVKYRQMK